MIIVRFNCQSSSAASSIGVGHNNSQHNSEIHNSSLSISNQDKFAILNFDDGWESHYQIVKPLLDKYHFKATFYIVCNYVEPGQDVDEGKKDKARMNWNEISELKK